MQSNNEIDTDNKRKVDATGSVDLKKLPTGKVNISFSELRTWKECSWRHKLQFIDHLDKQEASVVLDFGTAVHAAHEHFIKTRTLDTSIATTMLSQLWKKNQHKENIEKFHSEAKSCLVEIPEFYENHFPNWEAIDAEHLLYEKIDDYPYVFKGYVDAIIKTREKNKDVFWILDAKTTSWGWPSEKKGDENVRAQLILYRNFWAKKAKVDPKNVKCGFILLKRQAKPGQHCELVKSSVGDVTTERALKTVTTMLKMVERGVAIKNRESCQWCPYFKTKWCT